MVQGRPEPWGIQGLSWLDCSSVLGFQTPDHGAAASEGGPGVCWMLWCQCHSGQRLNSWAGMWVTAALFTSQYAGMFCPG